MSKYKGYTIMITDGLFNCNKKRILIKNEELDVNYCHEFNTIEEAEDYAKSIIDFVELVRAAEEKRLMEKKLIEKQYNISFPRIKN